MDATSFPAAARSKQTIIHGHDTLITTVSFSDKLLFTISQTGSMTHWVHVPLTGSADAGIAPLLDSFDADTALLPAAHLTATTVLGGTKQEDEVLGQTLASTIASAILLKNPDESRLLVMGLGIHGPASVGKAQFDEILAALLPLV